MNILLRLKNWQLFIITILLPTIIVIIKLSTVELENYETSEFNDFLGIVAFIYYVIFIFWNYNVTKTINNNEKALTKKQLKLFDWLLTVLIIYVLHNITHEYFGISQLLIVRILFWIFTFVSVYAFFYIIFCTSKTLKYIQLKNQLRTSDIIVEMFVILYVPIGMWWLQKKVNRYYNEIKSHKVQN